MAQAVPHLPLVAGELPLQVGRALRTEGRPRSLVNPFQHLPLVGGKVDRLNADDPVEEHERDRQQQGPGEGHQAAAQNCQPDPDRPATSHRPHPLLESALSLESTVSLEPTVSLEVNRPIEADRFTGSDTRRP